jgi:predicted O-methyltransferase YrrM
MIVLNDLDQNHRQGNMNVPVEDGRLLRMLTEATGAKNVVEIGTSNGYSGLWFLMALQETGGHLTTFEIDRDRADEAIANFKRAGVDKDVTLVFGDAHEKIEELKLDRPIDMVFLDADKEGYIDYLKKLLPHVRPGGLVIAHNMNTRQAHPPFVEAITKDPRLETLFLHMDRAGIAVTMKKR